MGLGGIFDSLVLDDGQNGGKKLFGSLIDNGSLIVIGAIAAVAIAAAIIIFLRKKKKDKNDKEKNENE